MGKCNDTVMSINKASLRCYVGAVANKMLLGERHGGPFVNFFVSVCGCKRTSHEHDRKVPNEPFRSH